MSKSQAIAIGKLKTAFHRLPFPDKFSRLVTVLLDHVDKETLICWPSRRRLAQQIGCSEKTVQRNLRAIRELGLFNMTTVGAAEMRRRVGNKIKVKDRHTYTIYRLNLDHPFWTVTELTHAKEIIRRATWRGIEQRCRQTATETSSEIIDPNQRRTQPSPLKAIENGRARPYRSETIPSLSNGDGTVSGTLSLQNNIRSTSVVSNELPLPTHHPNSPPGVSPDFEVRTPASEVLDSTPLVAAQPLKAVQCRPPALPDTSEQFPGRAEYGTSTCSVAAPPSQVSDKSGSSAGTGEIGNDLMIEGELPGGIEAFLAMIETS